MQIVIAVFVFAALTLLPGAWLTFGLPLHAFTGKARLALGAALSPAIVGAQLLALRFCGLSFATAAPLVLAINLPSVILILRALPKPLKRFTIFDLRLTRPEDTRLRLPSSFVNRQSKIVNRKLRPRSWPLSWRQSPAFTVGSLLFLLLSGYLLLPWTVIRNYRPFAWHALWHSDIVYAFTRSTITPEEPELAGLPLAYGWIGHGYWGVVGWCANLPPTVTYAVSNLIWLLIAFVLAYELARRGLGLQSSAALLGTGLMFLATNLIGAGAWLWAGDIFRWRFYLGDIRYTPFLSKYLGFETMPFAFALVLALALVCAVALRTRVAWLPVIIMALLTALGVIYPVLFPVGCLLAGGLVFLLVTKLPIELPAYRWHTLLGTVLGIAASITIFAAFTLFISQEHAKSLAQWSTKIAIFAKSLHVVSAFVPLGLLALPFAGRGLWQRNGPVLLLAATGASLLALYVLFDVRSLEYKFILAATIMLAPLAAATLDWLLLKDARSRWAWTLAIPLILAGVQQGTMFRSSAQVPDNRINAPLIDEQSFWLALAPSEPDAGWTAAVHNASPLNTILVTQGSSIHLGPFTNRSFYLPADSDGENTTGYSIDNELNLVELRGYSAAVFEQRQRVVETLYGAASPAQVAEAVQTLLQLQRPVAIRFGFEQQTALQWLQQQGIGKQLFADEQNVVWLIDAQQALATNGSKQASQQR
ncbi:MAG: hypothetical protein M3Q45_11960 [Chloroflexota bacterium]|nr:hypothetical protein [Chloroflexota bacterium]